MRYTVLFLVSSYVVVLGLKTTSTLLILSNLELLLAFALTLEVATRIITSGWKKFFSSSENIFDLVISLLCFLPVELNCFAIFRLFTALPGLNCIARKILISLPAVAYVVLLLAVHLYLYAIIGITLFAEVDPSHFGNMPQAFISLFQIVTLEGWVDLMNNLLGTFPIAAPLYFISFIIIGTIMILNVLVSVMTNAFVEAKLEAEISVLKYEQNSQFDLVVSEIRSLKKNLNRDPKPKLQLIVGAKA